MSKKTTVKIYTFDMKIRPVNLAELGRWLLDCNAETEGAKSVTLTFTRHKVLEIRVEFDD